MAGKVAVVVEGIVLSLLASASLAIYVPPEQAWWLQPIAAFTPYLGAAFLLNFLIGIACFRRRWHLFAALHLPVFLLFWMRFGSDVERALTARFAPNLDVAAAHETVRITSYNARNLGSIWLYAWGRNPPSGLEIYPGNMPYFRSAFWPRPDFACVQEAREEVRIAWPEGVYSESGGLAAIPVGRSSRLRFSAAQDFSYRSTRTDASNDDSFVRSVYQWKGRTIALYSVQLRSFRQKPWQVPPTDWLLPSTWLDIFDSLREDYVLRAEEARILRSTLDQEARPFIVCGDFNSTPYNWAYAHVARDLHSAADALRNVRSATYPAGLPLFAVDHVLASRHWIPVSARLYDSELSDHRSIEADFKLRHRHDRIQASTLR